MKLRPRKENPEFLAGNSRVFCGFSTNFVFSQKHFFNDVDTEEESTLNPKYEQTVHSLERATSLWRKEICKNVKHDTDSPEKVGTDTN